MCVCVVCQAVGRNSSCSQSRVLDLVFFNYLEGNETFFFFKSASHEICVFFCSKHVLFGGLFWRVAAELTCGTVRGSWVQLVLLFLLYFNGD